MAKKLMCITVKGKSGEFGFDFYGDPQYLEFWRDEGLQIDVIENLVPTWAVDLGIARLYCLMQDIFNFKFGQLIANWKDRKSKEFYAETVIFRDDEKQ